MRGSQIYLKGKKEEDYFKKFISKTEHAIVATDMDLYKLKYPNVRFMIAEINPLMLAEIEKEESSPVLFRKSQICTRGQDTPSFIMYSFNGLNIFPLEIRDYSDINTDYLERLGLGSPLIKEDIDKQLGLLFKFYSAHRKQNGGVIYAVSDLEILSELLDVMSHDFLNQYESITTIEGTDCVRILYLTNNEYSVEVYILKCNLPEEFLEDVE